MSRLTVIEAKNGKKLLRTCAYVRVSTKNEEQTKSYNNQIAYFKNLIESNNEYIFIDVFSDESTGTSMYKRDGFNRMIEKCKNGEIDFIITKSISRFSRNTKEFLEIIRMLKLINVNVYFQRENINTSKIESELFITILSKVAEEESFNISKNMKWRIQKSFKNGDYIPSYLPYGYERVGKSIEINNKEADIIKMIFNMYIDGKSSIKIAKYLTENNIKTRMSKNNVWSYRTVIEILKNPFYRGDLLMGKTYTTDTLPFKCKKNNGERDMYLIKNNHFGIVSESDFDKVQKIIKLNRKNKSK